MKLKFFLTSLVFIVSIALATLLISRFYYAKEREWLLDQQIEAIASGLLANELGDAELTEMDDIVADALFDQPRTILINIYNERRELLYQNLNSQNILGDETPPLTEKLFTHKSDDHLMRFLNFPLPKHKTLQVGLLLDQQMSQILQMNQRIFILVAMILIVVLMVAWMQASILVRPLEELTRYINALATNLEKDAPRPTIPPTLEKLMQGRRNKEIQLLWESLHYFKTAFEAKIRLTKTTVAQMAHELKTPLTVIRNSFEYLQLKGSPRTEIETKFITSAIDEADRLSVTISRFLAWSRFESLDNKENIHALKLHDIIAEVAESVAKAYPQHQYELSLKQELQVFANPEDLRQLLRNLVDNAFKYSSETLISLELNEENFLVTNYSQAVPAKVFERLGEPFNAGKVDGNKSIGLGLAWITSISKRYNWDFSFRHEEGKTLALVHFPKI